MSGAGPAPRSTGLTCLAVATVLRRSSSRPFQSIGVKPWIPLQSSGEPKPAEPSSKSNRRSGGLGNQQGEQEMDSVSHAPTRAAVRQQHQGIPRAVTPVDFARGGR